MRLTESQLKRIIRRVLLKENEGQQQPSSNNAVKISLDNSDYDVIHENGNKNISAAVFIPKDMKSNGNYYLYQVDKTSSNLKPAEFKVSIKTTPRGIKDLQEMFKTIGQKTFSITESNVEKPSVQSLFSAIGEAMSSHGFKFESRRRKSSSSLLKEAMTVGDFIKAAGGDTVGQSSGNDSEGQANTKEAEKPEGYDIKTDNWLWEDAKEIIFEIAKWWAEESEEEFDYFVDVDDDEDGAAKLWESIFDNEYEPLIKDYETKEIKHSNVRIQRKLESVRKYNVESLRKMRGDCAEQIRDYFFQNNVKFTFKELLDIKPGNNSVTVKKHTLEIPNGYFELGYDGDNKPLEWDGSSKSNWDE